jgi:prophage DNA circulation protein
MAWINNLQSASFSGVEFEVVSISDSTSRRIVENEYLGRDGAVLEDLGRGPQRGNCTAIFYGADYEDSLNKFIDAAHSGIPSEFIHPVLGSIPDCLVRIQSMESSASIGVDSMQVVFEYVQDGIDITVEKIESVQAIQAEIEAELVAEPLISAIEGIYGAVRGYYADAVSTIDSASASFDAVSDFIDSALKDIANNDFPDNYAIVKACKRIQYSCEKLKTRVESLRSPMKSHQVNHVAPISAVTASLMGNTDKIAEILERNKLKNPFLIKPGTNIQVPAK